MLSRVVLSPLGSRPEAEQRACTKRSVWLNAGMESSPVPSQTQGPPKGLVSVCFSPKAMATAAAAWEALVNKELS